jgi:adenylate cyclase
MLDAITNSSLPNEYKAFSIKTDEIVIPTQRQFSEFDFKIQPNYCVTFAEKQISYCIGIVDMVNSTKIAAILGIKRMSVYYQHFLNLMSKLVIEFDGQVIKNIGDCLLFYFPKTETLHNALVLKKCLECSLAMIDVRDFLCSQMRKSGLPQISYRVSMDYGSVIPMKSTDANSQDIGGDLYQITKHLDGITFKEIKGCPIGFKNDYPVYKITKSRYEK